ncbi:MAG TPA: MarR family transcriptional regulator [Acidimicrobiales bacterium]|nr:MarR family transcriptional regulator [Acidimicrobiales bacterium]
MSDLDWLDPDEYRVMRAFSRAARGLFVQLDRELQRDVSMPRTYFEILWLLNNSPGQTLRMSELAEVTGSQPSRITHAVARLEEFGQVNRQVCLEDRRGWLAVLTPEGVNALRRATPRHAQSIREHLLDPLSPEQREQLAAIGETVLAHLEHVRDAGSEPRATTKTPTVTANS